MEYAYARDPERRLRALAMTLYLDPMSPRIVPATADERRRAAAWGEQNNPFLRQPGEAAPAAVASIATL
jgi:hypothetical protein